MLHIHNGDGSAGSFKESGRPGEIFPFREALVEGPTPRDVSLDEWFSIRARFLAEEYDAEEPRKNLVEQHEALRRFRDHEEVVLWFSYDLFCQVTLLYMLSWFNAQDRGDTKLSLICIDSFPGVAYFQCLGQLTGEQLSSLFDQRHEITGPEFELGAAGWSAYCSPDPMALEQVLARDTSPLPYLRGALLRHLARFPSLNNGLGYVERRALQLIAEGHTDFGTLFPRFSKSDLAYGFGDSQVWSAFKLLGQAKEPLLTKHGKDGSERAFDENTYHNAVFALTETGEAVLSGQRDFIEVNGVDLWLGGAHLTGGDFWRWDGQNQKLVRG